MWLTYCFVGFEQTNILPLAVHVFAGMGALKCRKAAQSARPSQPQGSEYERVRVPQEFAKRGFRVRELAKPMRVLGGLCDRTI